MEITPLIEYLRGRSSKGYNYFGAHPVWEDGREQMRFTVYAPAAAEVALIGDFNDWQPWPMQRLDCGVWTLCSPDPQYGQRYKYRITTAAGEKWDRADPFAFCSEVRPHNASVLHPLPSRDWQDHEWMAQRSKNYDRPLSIYELHAGSWKIKNPDSEEQDRFYSYDELAEQLVPYVKKMGYTHIELLPLTEYPLDASWGYQVSGYFSATSRYGSPEQLMELIERCHRSHIGVILDFVPVHFVRDFHALHLFDGSSLYEPDDPDHRYTQWDTALFDFTKPHVISFLRSSLDFWISQFHFDGIRYDAVSNLIYRYGKKEDGLNDPGLWAIRSINYTLQQDHPEVMLIAEDSSDYLKVTAPVCYGGLGFDYKWNLGWMHDTLDYFATPFDQRAGMKNRLLFSMSYFYQDIYLLPLSHDEVVHGKRTIIDKLWGNYEQKFAQLRCLYLYMMFHPGKKLSFMGNELAEFMEWSEQREPGWNLMDCPAHRDFCDFLQKLNALYVENAPLWQCDYDSRYFEWKDMGQVLPQTFAILRKDNDDNQLLLLLNLSDRDCPYYPLRSQQPVTYLPLLDSTDAARKPIPAVPLGQRYYAEIPLPALSGVVLRLQPSAQQEKVSPQK